MCFYVLNWREKKSALETEVVLFLFIEKVVLNNPHFLRPDMKGFK